MGARTTYSADKITEHTAGAEDKTTTCLHTPSKSQAINGTSVPLDLMTHFDKVGGKGK